MPALGDLEAQVMRRRWSGHAVAEAWRDRRGRAARVPGVGAWMVLWALAGVVTVALVVAGAVWAAHELGQRGRRPPGDDPQQILRRRYAAGEIGEDEYLRRLSGLSQR